jgi:hypothetical protein
MPPALGYSRQSVAVCAAQAPTTVSSGMWRRIIVTIRRFAVGVVSRTARGSRNRIWNALCHPTDLQAKTLIALDEWRALAA